MSAEEDMLERAGICESVPAEDLPGMEQGIFRGLHLGHIGGQRTAVFFQITHQCHSGQNIRVREIQIHGRAVHPRQTGNLPD